MSKVYSQCPKCQGLLEDDGTCSCGYGFRRKSSAAEGKRIKEGPLNCCWNDLGRTCPSRGIISGGAGWYCREHWEKLQGRVPEGTGNYPPKPTPRTLYAKRWDGWYENWLATRDRKPHMPDFADLVPEEAGQS